ncbi:MAG: hypothetical protein IJW46_04920, partial [Clostridia bacterium]|nr:hypothetical protein [Clostridia bacterium]
NALINGVTVPLIGGTTPWVLLDPYELPDDVPLTISLPDTVGNEMMGQKAEVTITVEAIQGDGIIRVSTLDELVRAIAIGGNIALLAPIQIDSNLIVDNDVTIYGDISSQLTVAKNASIQVTDGGSLTVSGLVFDEGQTAGFDNNGKFVIDDLTARRTKPLFEVTAGGKLELGSGTVFKNITATSTAVVRANGTADNRSTVVFKGTMITDCVGETGAILDAASNCDVFIEEGTVISNNVSCDNANHGILKVYSGSVLTINGGLISDNIYSGNGLIGIYDTGRNSMVVMNGGIISGNSFVYGSDALIDGTDVKNGRHGLIYVHRHT